MTAEVAVLNTQAVALAADSASTISGNPRGPKVYNAANKLFALSPAQPVGIMIYDSAEICGVPWETVVKEFRKQHDAVRDTLADYLVAFLEFCDGNEVLFPEEQEDAWAEDLLVSVFDAVREAAAADAASRGTAIGEELVSRITATCEAMEKMAFIPGHDAASAAAIVDAQPVVNAARERAGLTSLDEQLAARLASACLYREHSWTPRSGVVIAGFGAKDRFPALVEAQIFGLRRGRLTYHSAPPTRVTPRERAIVRAFAQTDMTHTFMEGVHPEYARFIREQLRALLTQEYPNMVAATTAGAPFAKELASAMSTIGESAVQLLLERAQQFIAENSVDPITQALEFLPKEELAALAESLVNLTSLRKRVSLDAETVGGPVDVAVISKGDGFVWMRRKHYFRPELNPQFFAKYLGGMR